MESCSKVRHLTTSLQAMEYDSYAAKESSNLCRDSVAAAVDISRNQDKSRRQLEQQKVDNPPYADSKQEVYLLDGG